jgi:transcriptional regulator with XRE-family HTH domain
VTETKNPKKPRRIDYATVIFTREMGVRMVYARRKMKLTQDRMAKLLLISRSELSRIEGGNRRRPLILVSHLQDILGRHFKYVIDGTNYEDYERWRYLKTNQHGDFVADLSREKKGNA